jgi:hypothetical protein
MAVDVHAALGQAVPAQQQTQQRRLAGPGAADDGHVFAGGDIQVDVTQDLVATGQHLAALDAQRDAIAVATGAARPGRGRRAAGPPRWPCWPAARAR